MFSYRDSVVGFTDDFTCLIRNASKQINPGINKGFDLLFKGDQTVTQFCIYETHLFNKLPRIAIKGTHFL